VSAADIARACAKVTGLKTEARAVSPAAFFQGCYGVGQGEQFRYQLAMIRAVALWCDRYAFAGAPTS
jgi:hypothetical protein